jgi:alpha-glucoside transport system permease protein
MILRSTILAVAAVFGVPAGLTLYIFLVERGVARLRFPVQKRIRPWLWVAPGLAILSVFLLYPVVNTLVLSLLNSDSTRFIGFQNYARIFTDREMLIVLRNNALWLVFFTLVTVTVGLLIAVLTDKVRYEQAAKALIFLPMAISFVAAGVIWKFMYEFKPKGVPQIGTLNAVLTTLFPSFEPQAWLFNPDINNWALIVVGIWIWTGFAMVILSASIKGVPKEIVEAARIDGAGEFQVFFRITLPIIKPTIMVVTTTLIINVLKIFDIVYVMTNGILNTEVIANRMYKEMFNFMNFGMAGALAVLLLVAIVPVMLMNIKRFGQRGGVQ